MFESYLEDLSSSGNMLPSQEISLHNACSELLELSNNGAALFMFFLHRMDIPSCTKWVMNEVLHFVSLLSLDVISL